MLALVNNSVFLKPTPNMHTTQCNIMLLFNTVRGRLKNVKVSFHSATFYTNPPMVTLTAESRGGPPTHYGWTYNLRNIHYSSSFRISIKVGSRDVESFLSSHYVCTLTVHGRYPGLYRYYASNEERRSLVLTDSYRIEGIL